MQSLGTPWQQFFKSKAVWANHVGFAVSEWGRYLILTHLPTYMHDVLHVDITEVARASLYNTNVTCSTWTTYRLGTVALYIHLEMYCAIGFFIIYLS